MQFTKNHFLEIVSLVVIICIGGFIYLTKLETSPPGFYIDEALPGYSAYSILQTGKDEYGFFMPLVFRFYGSYNPPIFTYLTVLSVKLLGLSIFSVRIVSVLSGLLTIPVVYLFLKSLKVSKSPIPLYISTLLFAITPWFVFYSRIGYEVVVAFLLLAIGVWLSALALKNKKYLAISFILLSLSTYAAYAERFIVPLYIVGFLILFSKKFKKNIIKSALLLAAITQIPNFYLLKTPAFFPKSNLFNQSLVDQAEKIFPIIPYHLRLFLAFFREFSSQYTEYFSPLSLFFKPDPDPQRSLPDLSVFYPWMISLYLVGLYILFKNRSQVSSKLLLLLLIVCPIPAALTHDPFATHRALPLLLPLIGIIALGVNYLYQNFKKPLVLIFPAILAFSLLLLWRALFITLPYERATVWMDGTEELAKIIQENPNKQFIIDQSRLKPLYANLAFFLEYDPSKFQEEVDQTIKENYYHRLDFDPHFTFGNIDLRQINWEEDPQKNIIIVGDPLTVSETQAKEHNLVELFEIKNPKGDIIFRGYKTNPNSI